MAEQQHNYTGILLILFAVLILLGAVFFTVSQANVTKLAEYKSGNSSLQTAKNDLIVAYVLGYIAGGMALVLAILYFGHVTWGIQSEMPHLILFVLLFILIIVSGIFGFLALNEVDKVKPVNKNSVTNWIWAAEAVGLAAIIILIISGAWRAHYVTTKTGTTTMDPKPASVTFTTSEYSPPVTTYTNTNYGDGLGTVTPLSGPYDNSFPDTSA